jgi:hypothetical protein
MMAGVAPPVFRVEVGIIGLYRITDEAACVADSPKPKVAVYAGLAVSPVTARSFAADILRLEAYSMTLPPDCAKPGTPVLLGIPFDANSSWLRGAAGAPPIIRVAFNSFSSNPWTETGVDLSAEGMYCDAGDLKFTFEEPFPRDRKENRRIAGSWIAPGFAGRRPLGNAADRSRLWQAGAGPDDPSFRCAPRSLRRTGRQPAFACLPVRAHHGRRLGQAVDLQVGIRTLTGHQREQAAKFGVEMIEMRQLAGARPHEG